MRNFIPLWVFVLSILEVSTLTIGRNIDKSKKNVDDIGSPLLEYYIKLRTTKTKLNPKGTERLSLELLENDFNGETNLKTRNGVLQETEKWKNAVIPYTLAASFSKSQKDILERAMARIQSISNIRFKSRTSETDYVQITQLNDGDFSCYSNYVGKKGGSQILNMDDACFNHDAHAYHLALHELLHVAGFYHQQNAPDRDEYLIIHWENIKKGLEPYFNKIDSETFNVPYDYCSIMHYSSDGFSDIGKGNTMEKRKFSYCIPGFKPDLSYRDIRNIICSIIFKTKAFLYLGKLNLLYGGNPCGGNGWKYHDKSGKCYQILNEKKSWHESRLACQALSDEYAYVSDLAVIKSQAENDFIHSILKSSHYWSWIGLHDTETENKFLWIDRSTVEYSENFNNFNQGEPNDAHNNEDCVEMYRWWRPGKWNDNNCNMKNYPICQQFSKEPCLEGWEYSQGYCFTHFVQEKFKSGEEARAACESLAKESSLVLFLVSFKVSFCKMPASQ